MTVDLTSCEREPIHIPGSVQPHGVLFALDPASLRIEQVSQNVQALLGREPASLLGQPIEALLSAASRDRLQRKVMEGVGPSVRHLGVDGLGTDRTFDLLIHQYDDVIVFEAEDRVGQGGLSLERTELLRESLDRAERATSIEMLAQQVVADVRSLSGYDRVMFYRFARDGSGEVLAESLDPARGLEPFLGLRYPASDIPRQARAAMVQKRSRLIADARAPAAPLLPVLNPRTRRPLDLTHAELRSSSPVHLEYLGNMGVAASLTISIVVDGQLWGLVACHHTVGPRLLSYDARLSCEHLSRTVSLHVSRQLERYAAQIRERGQSAREAFIAALPPHAEENPSGVLLASAAMLEPTLSSSGFALVTPEAVRSSGLTPGEAELRALTQWLSERGALDVWATDSLFEAGYPDADRIAGTVSGVVALPLTRAGGEWLLWLRAEEARTVTWAGQPDKAVVADEKGVRLSPRKSFEAWVQSVRYRSAPWDPAELQSARRLRVTLAELVYRHSERVERMNVQLRQLNAELDAFAHVASHDLKAPVRSIRNFATWILEDAGDTLPGAARAHVDQVIRLTDRMYQLVESLMRFSRSGRRELKVELVPLDQVVRDVLVEHAAGISAANAQVRMVDALPHVRGDQTMLREIFGNLVANALKYTDRPVPHVDIGVRQRGEGTVQVFVRDDGIGIPPESLEEVFQVFRRLHPQDAYQGGSGVGLSIVHNLVSRHGGQVDVESTLGEGTTFLVTLPTA